MLTKVQGVVRVFNESKGFGFISVPGQKDVFCHFSAIKMEGFKTLKVGDKVELVIIETPKGHQAGEVMVLA